MSNQADHTIVRLRVPPELKEKIEKAAEENNRSQSAEMVSRLEESFTNLQKHQIEKNLLEYEIQDLRELFKQSTEANHTYFQLIVDLLNKKNSEK